MCAFHFWKEKAGESYTKLSVAVRVWFASVGRDDEGRERESKRESTTIVVEEIAAASSFLFFLVEQFLSHTFRDVTWQP